MKCTQCGAENIAGAQVCAACGTPLGGVGQPSDPAAAYPPAYGAPAPAPGGYAPPAYAPQPGYAQQPVVAPPEPPKKKKRHGCLITTAIVLVVILLGCGAAAFALTTFGKPRDLGVSFTEADYQSAVSKLGIQVTDTAPDLPVSQTKMVYRGKKKVSVKLTSAEVSAAVSMHHRSPNWVLQDVQILLGDNDQFQMSGYAMVAGRRYPFYADLTAQLAGPQSVSGTAQNIVVFGVDFPKQYYPAAEDYLVGAANDWLAGMGEGLDITSASIANGQLLLDGTVPAEAVRMPLSGTAATVPTSTP
jgi:hypothetical protein